MGRYLLFFVFCSAFLVLSKFQDMDNMFEKGLNN